MERVVAFDARMLESSGIGTYLRNLLEKLATIEDGCVYEVICPRKEALGSLPPDRFRFVPAKSPIYSLSEQWEIARIARRAPVLHSPHYNAPLLYRGNLVVTIHDLTHVTDPTFRRTLAARFYARPMLNLVARRADRIIADSEFTKQQIVEHLAISPSKVSVVYLGVNNHFRPFDRKLPVPRVLSSLGLRRSYILFVGNLKPHKNLKTLIRAFSHICARRDFEYQLVILGDDRKWKAGLVNECRNLGIDERTLFVPHVPYEDLPCVYAAAETLVMPSFVEGFGLPVLEAMACGTPVICSRGGSLPEVAGEAAEYFDPSSEDNLAEVMQKVLESPTLQASMRAKGLERARVFSWEQCAGRHAEIYRQLLER